MAEKDQGIAAELDAANERKEGVQGYEKVSKITEPLPAPPKAPPARTMMGGAGKKAVDDLIQSTQDEFKKRTTKASPKRSSKR
jgi:hypothetical protein